MTVDDGLSLWAYANGEDPLDHAVSRAAIEIEVAGEVTAARRHDPRTFPAYGATPTPETTARKIIARLLDAGWKPPNLNQEPQ